MATKTVQSVRGFHDFLPERTKIITYTENLAREIFTLYDFEEIRTPILEKTELFTRSIGEHTDIVSKEMYTFIDQGGDTLTLRPEGTAPVVRAYLEHGFAVKHPESRFFYIGPMFRRERPQKGRFRQFHQIGAELFGIPGPEAEAEIISLQLDLLNELGLENPSFELNSLGCLNCQTNFRAELIKFLEPRTSKLCPTCQRRLSRNPLRILDCKETSCRSLLKTAPSILQFLCIPCHQHFLQLQDLLTSLEIKFTLNPFLVRGLDYYTRTTFEFFPPNPSGSAEVSAISAGGRYDTLVSALGGPPIPAVGFALGLERVLSHAQKLSPPPPKTRIIFISLDHSARQLALKLSRQLRKNHFTVRVDLKGGSLKSQLHRADREGFSLALIIGEEELHEGNILVRDLNSGTQAKVPCAEILSYLSNREKPS